MGYKNFERLFFGYTLYISNMYNHILMIPNFIFENIIKNDENSKYRILNSLAFSAGCRAKRIIIDSLEKRGIKVRNGEQSHSELITVYNNENKWDFYMGNVTENFSENHQFEPKKIPSYILTKYIDGTYDMYHDIYSRESYDNGNISVLAFDKFGLAYNNAFWDGNYLVFGEGDGLYFNTFIIPDVIAHEFSHAVQSYETNFIYHGESGALNEHISDVFGIHFSQLWNGEDVNTSDWLIGKGIWTTKVNGVALRSMKNPGTAYDDEIVGKDPQPDHMDKFVITDDDEGGVHINSGIPNRAFYFANQLAGGTINTNGIGEAWYKSVLNSSGLSESCDFEEFAQKTVDMGKNNNIKSYINKAWDKVGIKTEFVDSSTSPCVMRRFKFW